MAWSSSSGKWRLDEPDLAATDEDQALVAAARADPFDERRHRTRRRNATSCWRRSTTSNAEYEAGDLDDADYEALKANYTTRAAAGHPAASTGPRLRSKPTRPTDAEPTGHAWMVAGRHRRSFATLAGVLVAQFSGSRGTNDTISGEIRVTARELLRDAQVAFSQGDLDAAIGIYDEVLEIQPSNAEALTYKAWFTRLQGDPAAASPLIEDAVAIDPDYPDARVFATAIALDLDDVETAQGHLDAFDLLSAPPFLEQLVAQQGLRARLGESAQIAATAKVEQEWLTGDDPVPFGESGVTVDEVLLAAEARAAGGDVFGAISMVQLAREDRPDDPDLLAGYAWLLARSASFDEPAPAELAASLLDQALALDPAHPEALVYRSFTRAFLGDLVGAGEDLAAFDALAVQPADLREIIAAFGLRDQVAAG